MLKKHMLKVKPTRKVVRKPKGEAFELAKLLFSLIKNRDDKIKEPNWIEWTMHIERLNKVDGRDFTEIKKVIYWCQNDTFWQNNILSTAKLKKQFTQLRLKMNSKPKIISRDIPKENRMDNSNPPKPKQERIKTMTKETITIPEEKINLIEEAPKMQFILNSIFKNLANNLGKSGLDLKKIETLNRLAETCIALETVIEKKRK